MKALVERLEDEPFELIGLNAYDDRPDFEKGVEEFGVTWLVAYQGLEAAISELYQVRGYPTMYVLDTEGRIAGTGLRGKALGDKVDALLAELKTRQ